MYYAHGQNGQISGGAGDGMAGRAGARGYGRRPGRPGPPLTVERIAVAAVELLDENGVGQLTMRRLADRLGVGTTTLYWHVDTKEDVIDLAVDAVFAATPPPPAGDDWRAERHDDR